MGCQHECDDLEIAAFRSAEDRLVLVLEERGIESLAELTMTLAEEGMCNPISCHSNVSYCIAYITRLLLGAVSS